MSREVAAASMPSGLRLLIKKKRINEAGAGRLRSGETRHSTADWAIKPQSHQSKSKRRRTWAVPACEMATCAAKKLRNIWHIRRQRWQLWRITRFQAERTFNPCAANYAICRPNQGSTQFSALFRFHSFARADQKFQIRFKFNMCIYLAVRVCLFAKLHWLSAACERDAGRQPFDISFMELKYV